MAARGLKKKIALNVAILLLISAVLTDIMVIIIMQSAMIRNEVDHQLRDLETAGGELLKGMISDAKQSTDNALTIQCLLPPDNMPRFIMADPNSVTLYQRENLSLPAEFIKGTLQETLRDRKPVVKKHGKAWAIFWWRPKFISLSVPLFDQGEFKGAIGGLVPLSNHYLRIRQYHKPIFFYLIFNTTILTLIGLYRIFRVYLRPIDRIVRQADDFRDSEDVFFAFRHEDNELNRLSSALNRMLHRITEDKKKLEETVMFLERANAELKNAQKEILRAEKLASVGRLAAGVAHEIGNPIGIVLGYLEMLKQNGLEEEDRSDFLKRSEDEIQRINAIIRQLLDLARPKESWAKAFSLHACISDIIDVMRIQPMMKHIEIVLNLSAGEDQVWGNDEQMRQVFLNLLLNAADAIKMSVKDGNGQITIQSEVLASPNESAPNSIQIRFSDNGAGMTSEQLQNIFDPFYTTKEAGKGTGLGLAVSYMIIDSMQGEIAAESRIGQGTDFKIRLPLYSGA